MAINALDRERYYFKNGTLYANSDIQIPQVLISSVEDLESNVLKNMEPGTIAHLPGKTESYELSPNHEWVKCVESKSSSGSSSGSGSGSGSDGEPVVYEGMTAEERMKAEEGN